MTLKTLIVLLSSTVMSRSSPSLPLSHIKCRGGTYPRSQVQRFDVPDDKISWSTVFEDYKPFNYTFYGLHGKPYADPVIDDPNFHPKWNSIDGKVNRESYTGAYIIENGYPLNPVGRTGIIGRGILGRWGPNHAADPIVTRWKRLSDGQKDVHPSSHRPILQFVAIKRGDTGEWALPGGMVDPGEKVASAAVREFQEEATNSMVMSDEQKRTWQTKFSAFFDKGDIVYQGYVDDPRNTDNAWMETIAYNFHDEVGNIVGNLALNAGDDAVGVKWIDMDSRVRLYASHGDLVRGASEKLGAHW